MHLAGNCLHPPIAKTNGLARLFMSFRFVSLFVRIYSYLVCFIEYVELMRFLWYIQAVASLKTSISTQLYSARTWGRNLPIRGQRNARTKRKCNLRPLGQNLAAFQFLEQILVQHQHCSTLDAGPHSAGAHAAEPPRQPFGPVDHF